LLDEDIGDRLIDIRAGVIFKQIQFLICKNYITDYIMVMDCQY